MPDALLTGKPETILVVNDNPIVLKVVVAILKSRKLQGCCQPTVEPMPSSRRGKRDKSTCSFPMSICPGCRVRTWAKH